MSAMMRDVHRRRGGRGATLGTGAMSWLGESGEKIDGAMMIGMYMMRWGRRDLLDERDSMDRG